jgi:threonine dehydrogenase-like Zn-dependent dehydrogenase
MEIFQLTSPGQFVIRKVSAPRVGPNQVLVEIRSVVTCPQWDQRLFLRGENPLDMKAVFPQPLGWPGHEAAGTIREVGPGVTGLRVGDHVAVIYVRVPEGDDMGLYAPLASLHSSEVVKLEPSVDFDGAASYGMLRDIVYSVRKFGDVAGKVVAVTGLGSAGLMAVQVFRAFGASTVIGIDPSEARRALVLERGFADIALDPLVELDVARLPGARLQFGLDCSGVASSMQLLLDHASQHIVIFGVPHGDIHFGLRHWGGEERKLQGININLATEEDNRVARELLESGKVDGKVVATHRGYFRRYDEAVEMLRSQKAIKVYFRPSEELSFEE